MLNGYKVIAFASLAAVLLGAVLPFASALLWVIFVPFLLFSATLAVTQRHLPIETSILPTSPYVSIVASRAPPRA